MNAAIGCGDIALIAFAKGVIVDDDITAAANF
jgi:hypothetical protein